MTSLVYEIIYDTPLIKRLIDAEMQHRFSNDHIFLMKLLLYSTRSLSIHLYIYSFPELAPTHDF